MKVKKVSAASIRKLRHQVLRAGKPFSTTAYDKDEDQKTFHLGCLDQEKIVTCATFYPEEFKHNDSKKAYRLRGMATALEYRRKGHGKKIMLEAFKEIKKQGGDLLWCNARLVAVSFYQHMGLKTIGELFDIDDIGPHYIMFTEL